MKKLRSIFAAMTLVLINGCNGDNSPEETQPEPVPITPIAIYNGIEPVQAKSRQYVDVSSYIDTDVNGAKLLNVTTRSDAVCHDISIENTGFFITLSQEGICEVEYKAQSIPLAGHLPSEAIAQLVLISSVSSQADFAPISVALIENAQVTIDLAAELAGDYPTGYTLSATMPVLGSGQVSADLPNALITYQAESAGLSRVVYTFENGTDTKMGYIDLSVSQVGSQPPVTTKFKHTVTPDINQNIIIDLTPYVSDPDGDDLQLVEVMSYNATVASTDPGNITNKAFSFTATTAGLHYVSYLISDHRGGFSSNLVEVEVVDPNQLAKWADIEVGLNIFSAPLTQVEADQQGVSYSGTSLDSGYTPAMTMATMSLDQARTYCSAKGRLPTSTELSDLAVNDPPNANHNWPAESLYIAEDGGNGMLVEFDSGITNPILKGNYYVTCISDGSLTLIPIDVEALADGVDMATFDVELRLNGQLVDGETLTATVTIGDAILENTSVVTSGGGKARFELTSNTIETATVEVDYNNQQQVAQQVDFISVADPIIVSSITIDKNRADANGVDVNTVSAQVTNSITTAPVANVRVDVYLLEEIGSSNGSASGPSFAITDANGDITVDVTNTEAEVVDVRVNYLTTDPVPVNRFLDARTSFHVHNEVSPIEVVGLIWSPPFTDAEAAAIGKVSDNNYTENGGTGPNGMVVSRFLWGNADDFCSSLTYLDLFDWRLPTEAELTTLYNDAAATHPTSAVWDKYGWPTGYAYWSSTAAASGYYKTVTMWDGYVADEYNNQARYVGCVHAP